ncbi:amidohydrolase 2 [Xylariaceae sp. FL1651]|nr:amidohydrolase 2 [Xylariaceae sp. FL1651]
MRVFDLTHHLLSSMAVLKDQAQDWLLDKTIGWPGQPLINKIDIHHHMVPDFYADAIAQNGGDPSGWPTPDWSPTASQLLMQHMGIQSAILSVTAPGACIVKEPVPQQELARKLNEYAAALRNEDPNSFGFFASLPDIRNSSAAIKEIAYAIDELGADGVTLFTRYGPGKTYLGHAELEPVWAELNRREAVVFIHPTNPVDTDLVNPRMLQPMIDFPHETTRTAVDMIMSRTLQKYPNVKVILSNAGGTLPYLITRLATPLRKTPDLAARWKTGTTYEETMSSFRKFYFDVAQSSAPQVLSTLLTMVPHDHILFGSDFPFAPATAYPAFLEELENADIESDIREKINFGNAQGLIPRLAKGICVL